MTDRGMPTEGAPACPFVAFEDDRDARSTAPDHRHRCFAEPRPAPRAVAHQEAYCLASAFPVCPTFQDWARREAAAARPAAAAHPGTREEPPQSRPMPPLDRDPYHGPAADTPPPVPPRRSTPRNWAAPPPWSGADGGTTGAVPGAAADAPWGAAPGSREAARQPAEWGSEARGLAGSAAHRLAGPDPDEPQPAVPERHDRDDRHLPAHGEGEPRARRGSHDDLDDDLVSDAGASTYAAAGPRPPVGDERYVRPSRRQPPPSRDDELHDEPRPASRDQVRRPAPQDAQQLFGPAWEAPRRYEAYPSLRTRMGLPGLNGIPRVALWALVLLIAALFLFLWGPSLLGLTGDDGGLGAATPSPAASAEPTAEPEPTQPPAPTPQVYVVRQGDTMSKIAKRFGVTVEDILAANPQIKNPDRIGIGDEVTIPAPEAENGFGDDDGVVEGESATP